MTKKRNARNTKSAAEATTGAYESAFKALSGLQSKLEIPESAREFVKRTAATAKERAAAMHDGANKMAGVIEGAIVDGVTGVADVNRKRARRSQHGPCQECGGFRQRQGLRRREGYRGRCRADRAGLASSRLSSASPIDEGLAPAGPSFFTIEVRGSEIAPAGRRIMPLRLIGPQTCAANL